MADKEKFSYSKLDAYEQCPYQYKLTYVDKHWVNSSSIATEVGTLIHETEESIAHQIKDDLFGVNIDYDYLKKNIVEKFKAIKAKYPDQVREKDKSDRTYTQKIDSYLNEGIYRLEKYMSEHPELEIVGIEDEFYLPFGDYLFHGFIDRYFRNKETGEYIIEDIKTYGQPKSHDELTTPLQFVFYSIALQNKYNIKQSQITCAYNLPFCDAIQEAGTSGFVDRGIKKINKLLEKIQNKNYAPNPSPLCHWCVFSKTYINGQPEDAKNLCPYFCHWTKKLKDFNVEYEWMGEENHDSILEAFISSENKQAVKEQELPKIELTEDITPKDFTHVVVSAVTDPNRRFLVRR